MTDLEQDDAYWTSLLAEEVSTNGAARPAGSHPWRPVDLAAILDGSYDPPQPTVGARDDDVGILYPGRRHDAYGESESAKTWMALLIVVTELAAGNAAVFVDFEDDPAAIVARLRALDVPLDAIRDRFAYIRPDEPLTAPGNLADLDQALGDLHPTLGVVDGVTEAMTMHGFDLRDNVDVAKFGRLLPGRIAGTGAAALCLDHVTKDRETGRRYAIGGQHKLAGLNGAAFLVENRTAFGLGVTGRSSVYLTKDRPAALRRHALPSAGGLHWFGDLVVGPVDVKWPDVLDGQFRAPSPRETEWRPTALMRHISEALAKVNTPLSQRDIFDRVRGKNEDLRQALAALIDDGYVAVESGLRGARMHRLTRAYGTEENPDE